MLRQRIRVRESSFVLVGRALVVLVSLAILWYGLMIVLLGLGVPRGTVNLLGGYRSAYDFLEGLAAADITSTVRIVTAVAGPIAFVVFGFLAWKQIPRPYAARGSLALDQGEGTTGTTTLAAHAIERVAEIAASAESAVSGARGRFGGEDLTVEVHVDRAPEVPRALREVQRRVTEALSRHGLPALPVSVMLTGFDRQQPRELN